MGLTPTICIPALWNCGTPGNADQNKLPLRLIPYNIRFDSGDHGEDNEPKWGTGMPLIVNQIAEQDAQSQDLLICLQEPKRHQLVDLSENLYNEADPNSWWDRAGWDRGRDAEAIPTDEYNAPFYQNKSWELDEREVFTYWLNEGLEDDVYENVEEGWDGEFPRILTIGCFKHKKTGARVVWGCSQLDYQYKKGETVEAPRHQAEWISKIAERWAEGGKYPVFIATDLNHERGSEPYKAINAGMMNVRDAFPGAKKWKTYTAFTDDESDDEGIDFIWVKDRDLVNLVGYDVLDNKVGDTYISDHRMVLANVEIPY